jgi:hypothetical protein
MLGRHVHFGTGIHPSCHRWEPIQKIQFGHFIYASDADIRHSFVSGPGIERGVAEPEKGFARRESIPFSLDPSGSAIQAWPRVERRPIAFKLVPFSDHDE